MPVSTIACTPSDRSGSISSVATKGFADQLIAHRLDDVLQQIEVGVVSHHDVEILHHPVARIVGDRLQVAERHCVQLAIQVPSLTERSEKLSTVPRMSPLSICSPTRNASSSRKKTPERMSRTRV